MTVHAICFLFDGNDRNTKTTNICIADGTKAFILITEENITCSFSLVNLICHRVALFSNRVISYLSYISMVVTFTPSYFRGVRRAGRMRVIINFIPETKMAFDIGYNGLVMWHVMTVFRQGPQRTCVK